MRIRLLQDPANVVVQKRKTRNYVMKAAPEWYHPTMSAFLGGDRPCFLFGQVRLWVLSATLTNLVYEYAISKRFTDEEAYLQATQRGFEVVPGSERAAKVLIAHRLAVEI